MNDYLPVVRSSSSPAVPTVPLSALATVRNARAVARHSREVDQLVRFAFVDTAALITAGADQYQMELAFVAEGRQLAGDDEVALRLLAEKLATISAINNGYLGTMFR